MTHPGGSCPPALPFRGSFTVTVLVLFPPSPRISLGEDAYHVPRSASPFHLPGRTTTCRHREAARAQGRRLAVTASSRTVAAAEIHKGSLQVVF